MTIILPVPHGDGDERHPKAPKECVTSLLAILDQRAQAIRRAFSQREMLDHQTGSSTHPAELAQTLTGLLTNRSFNYLSQKNVCHLLPGVRQNLLKQIDRGGPLRFFLLYNGGYRASPFPGRLSLLFEPDQTELMLLHQVALLSERVRAVYPPGINFSVVINNGVANRVNDIPLSASVGYAQRLRRMIANLDASSSVSVLLQSELTGQDYSLPQKSTVGFPPLTDAGHRVVERFLGRQCAPAEAQHRAALYLEAEAQWAQDLAPIVADSYALVLRQVAHPKMLSFRPFPGGAIRIQNGSLAFQENGQKIACRLITTQNISQFSINWFSCVFPWSAEENTAQIAECIND